MKMMMLIPYFLWLLACSIFVWHQKTAKRALITGLVCGVGMI